jgi:5-methylcytosine-specific restriction endonuclease McrA
MNPSVLVLNSCYEPLHTISMQKAICLIVKGVAEIQKSTDKVWRSVNAEFVLPSVIRLLAFTKLPKRTTRLGKRNIIIRDNHTCQYCLKVFSTNALTLDHIIPKAKGGTSKWDNLVAACKKCNTKKADKTPQEAGLVLAKKPGPMTCHSRTNILRTIAQSNPDWSEFIYI